MGCGDAPAAPAAPDYSGISAANEKSAELGYKAASERLAYDKSVSDQAAPYRDKLQQRAVDLADQQYAMAGDNQAFAKEQQDRYKDKFIPVEDRMIDEANAYGDVADQEREAGIAKNQVKVEAAGQREAATRRLQAMGIKPDSGAAIASNSAADVMTAAAAANAGNSARTTTRDKGIAMRTGVAAFGRGNTGAAVAANNTAITAGNSATGQLGAAANAGLPAAQLVDGGYGQGQQAAALGSQSALGMGNVLNAGYGISMNGYNAAQQQDSGMGQMIGGLAMAGAKLYAGSSKKIKHDKQPVDGDQIVDRIAAIPVEAWVYNDGVADGKKHVGPYAEDVQAQFGDDVAPGGEKIDLISMNGINMAATQAIAKRLKVLEGAYGIRRH